MDVSRSRQRESARDRGQEIRVWRGTEADGQGHKIKADSTIAAPECNCEANWAKEHLGRVQGSTSHASLELEKGLQAEAQRGILFLKPPSSVPLPIALAKCHLPLPHFQKKRGHLLEQRFSQPPFQFVPKPSTSVYMLVDSFSYTTSAVPECNSRLPLCRLYFIGHTLSFLLPSFSQCFLLGKMFR